jgi:abortive infection bacteriophage resistance protein
MGIDDDVEAAAILSRIGYYRISGYFYPLRKTQPYGTPGRQDDFQEGTSLTLISQLYEFDRQLRLHVLDAVERIEVAMRSDIAHRLGQRHRLAHEIPAQLDGKFCTVKDYRGKTLFENWCGRLDEMLRRAGKEDFVKHHRTAYGGKMPIWVVTEVWDFGLLSKFFAGMRYKDQLYIAQRYRLPEAKYLVSWLRAVNFARNVSAHHSRLWNRNFNDRPTFAPAQADPLLAHLVGNEHAQTRVYGTLCVLKTMQSVITPETDWADRLKALCSTFPESPLLSLESAGFPADWATNALWR